MKRVLLTGASGLVGRNAITPLRERGFEVVAVARRRPAGAAETNGVRWLEADLLDDASRRQAVEEASAGHLLHLAWYAEPGRYWEAPENLDWLRATVLLTREFASAGGERAVYAGTCAEYRWGGASLLSEGSPLQPATLYGVAKNATRQAVADIGQGLGISTAWGRIFFLYGPGEDERRLVASVARALVAGEPVATTAGTQVRDFLYVGDVGDAFAALTASGVEGAVNIASGEGVPVSRLTTLIGEASGRADLIDAGALEPRAGDPASIVADASVLNDQVGWEPKTGLAEGIAATVDWWKAAQPNTVSDE